ncbi:hypothetical protein CDAR_472011 [Caerostris darwini]|uniref:Uncharacterized protein n=1 Tax=Caerostris darwini TaxID=1538125 RepID=A0AAV4VME0_9ARAC|nr:hypothetical protein CDAR_472011 [Caerostris darwini]
MALEENYQEILSSVHFDGKYSDLFRLPPCIIDIRFIMHVPQTKSPTLQLLRSDLEGRKGTRGAPGMFRCPLGVGVPTELRGRGKGGWKDH